MKLFTFIALAALAVTASARDYGKPTKPAVDQPTASELTAGANYLIFNVGRKTYASGGEEYSTSLITQTDPFLVVTVSAGEGENSGYYQLKLNGSFTFGGWNGNQTKTDTYLFWDTSNNRGFVDYASGSTQVPYWKFTAVEGAERQYYWQTSAAENAKYLTAHSSGNRITFEDEATSDDSKWIFVAVSSMADYFYYKALRALYDAIESASGLGIDVDEAKAVFCNDNATIDELNAAQAALQKVVDSAISKSAQTTLSWSNATCSGGNTQVENGGNNIGYTGGESVVTLDVINGTDGQSYLMEFKTGAAGCSAILDVTLTNNSTSEVVLSEEVTVESHSNWDLVDNHSFFIRNMAGGAYRLRIATKQVTSGSFAGNWGRPTFTKVDELAETKTSLNWNNAVRNNCAIEHNGANIGSTHSDTYATFTIYNPTENGTYLMTFNTGASGCSAVVTVTLTDGNGVVVKEKDFDVPNIGTWDRNTKHQLLIENLAAGSYALKFATKSKEGDYAGNWGDLNLMGFTAIPGALDLNSGIYAPTGAWTIHVENNTNVGFIKNGHTAKYYIMNNDPGYYDLAISVSKQGQGGTYTVSIDDLKGNNEYKREAIEVGTDGDYTIHTIAVGKLTAGAKVLTLTFNATHDDWICNYKDVEFKAQTIQVAVSEAGYATLYDADKALTIPEGVQAYIVANETNSIQLTEVTGTIPTGVPVVVKAAEGTYNFAVADNVEADYSSNLLHGSATSDNVAAVDGTNYYYMLANGSKGIGFYWGTQNGTNAFSVGAGKAYLALPKAQNVKAFIFGTGVVDITTGIGQHVTVSSKPTTVRSYDLSGRRVGNPASLNAQRSTLNGMTKGIYVTNGKKWAVK